MGGGVCIRRSSDPDSWTPSIDVGDEVEKRPEEASETAVIGAGVAIDAATVKSPEGAGIDLATVAGKAAAADFVADAEAELEASVFSVDPGKTSDPFSCLFWDLSDPPIFWRGFANSPTF